MLTLTQIATVCYFLALVAAILKAWRYWLDWRRREQWFYLVGIPANLLLATALVLLIIGSGADPVWIGDGFRITLRLSIMLWAILSLLFEVLYVRTFVIFRK